MASVALRPTVLFRGARKDPLAARGKWGKRCSNALHQIQVPALEISDAEAHRTALERREDP